MRCAILRNFTNYFLGYCVVLCAAISVQNLDASAITCSGGGRLGDKLTVFIKTFYYAEKFGLTFLYPSVPYADKFAFSAAKNRQMSYKECRYITQEQLDAPTFKVEPDLLYILRYTAKDGKFVDELHDKKIIYAIKKLLAPRVPVRAFSVPKDCITVAVHVRKGSGTDVPPIADSEEPVRDDKKNPSDKIWPTKFPPDSFYVDQIRKLSEIFNDRPLYIYLFTDDKNPEKLVKKYQSLLQKPSITFNYRKGTHNYSDSMIEDFFALTQFDCLIRPDSGFSRIPEFIGDHAITIYPEHATWQGNRLTVDTIIMKIKKPVCKGIFLDMHKLNESCAPYIIQKKF